MFNYIKTKWQERKAKKTFKEYEFKPVTFNLVEEGAVQYAQWLHPGEFGNEVTQDNVNFYKQFISKGDFIIDVGANEGDTTVPMALAAGVEGTTLGFEPNPHAFKILKVNAGYNKDKTNITPLNFAATAQDGEFTFGSGDPSYGNGGIVGFTHNRKRNTRYTFQVTGKNLEQYLKTNYAEKLSRLTFIKIDAEGYDKEIIKTIPGIIDQYRPYLVTECFGPATDQEKVELYDILTAKNYVLYRLTDFTLKGHTKITRGDMAVKKTYDILAIPSEKAD
jgi:FkbM family methyltransferase